MLLHNQDRDFTCEYTGQELRSEPVFNEQGTLWGFNLFVDGVTESLGTFDSLEEITAEMQAITTADVPEWYVSGYSDYDGTDDWNAICDLMSEGETC